MYLAEHLKLKQYRALKCIPKSLAPIDSQYLEASLLKNLRHPGIPMVYDIEEDEQYFYIVEEYIQGESLSAFVQKSGNIPQETVLAFGIQLCGIIEYLHNQKPNPILYLDIKPEHIILCGKQLKLIDFGISSFLKENGNIFQSCGTRGFAAPEQYTGRGLNTQTDIFGIGAVLYYMLTRETLPQDSVSNFWFPQYCSYRFKKIIRKAVSPTSQERFCSAGQMQAALKKISPGLSCRFSAKHLLNKITIVGSQKHIGVTHISISLVSWLNRQGQKALYRGRDEGNILSFLLSYQPGVWEEEETLFYRDFQASAASDILAGAERPHIFVEDFGNNAASIADMEDCGLLILVIGSRSWELEEGIRAYERLAGEENLIVLCNYNDRQTVGEYASVIRKKFFYFPLDPDPFAVTKEKHRLFQQIIKERRR